jgi:EAL domain-containing protein (putative c-di-GMP-specific phosphodiesterase class I)
MAVVAEGVETKQQLDRLTDLGCDRAQGFYFGAAGPAETIAARLAGWTDTGPVASPMAQPLPAPPDSDEPTLASGFGASRRRAVLPGRRASS